MAYRISRNIEASLVQYIEEQLTIANWSNINVEKTFAKVYTLEVGGELNKAVICVRVGDTTHDKVEIGEDSTMREPLVLIDIFAANDGQKLDLKDFLISVLKSGLIYYEYTIISGEIDSKVQNGRIRVLNIGDTPVNFGIDKETLDVHDRYRHLLTLTINLGRVEP